MSTLAGLSPDEFDRDVEASRVNTEAIRPFRLSEDEVGFLGGLGRAPISGAVRVGAAIDAYGAIPLGSAIYEVTGYEPFKPDQLWSEHEETFGRTKKIITPTADEVTTAGQISFGLGQGLTELAAGGPLAFVATEQANTALDLAAQGVDATTAQQAGAIAGVANAVSVALPAAIGKTLTQKVITGAGLNVVAGAGADVGQKLVLEQGGYEEMAAQYDPFDLKARSVDALMGAAFGGLARLDGTTAKPSDKAAVSTLNAASQVENAAPGIPATMADMNAHVRAFDKAQQDLANGIPVDVTAELDGATFRPSPAKEAQQARMQAATAEVVQELRMTDPERFLTPDEITALRYQQDLLSHAADLGISEKKVLQLAKRTTPGALRDAVTGLYEARVGEGESNLRLNAIKRAQQLTEETGAPATYVHADIANLGGMNAVLTETGANVVFRLASAAFREELSRIGAEIRSLPFRHGGDEISGVVINATPEQAAAAMAKAGERVRQAAEQMTTPKGGRVSEIEHPKFPGVAEKRGTGLSYGASAIEPGVKLGDIIQQAERQLEAMKKEVTPNVPRITTGEPGAQPSGRPAGGTPEGAAAADRGIGRQNEGGQRGLSREESQQQEDALRAADQAVAENPAIPAIDEDTGQSTTASALLAKLDNEIQEAEQKQSVFAAAAACFLRTGGL